MCIVVMVLFLVLLVLMYPLLPRSQDAFLRRETFASKPPPHALCADIYRCELEKAISYTLVPAVVSPVEEKGEDAVAERAVQFSREPGVHCHHEGDEGVDAEDDAEHAWGNNAHEFDVHFSDEGASVDGWCECTEDADFVAEVGALFFCEGDEGLSCALGMADEA